MITAYIALLRPTHWLKNLMLLFPPFLAGLILTPGVLAKGILPFWAFCLVSSAGYIFNDLLDREQDQGHPLKRLRPLASGIIKGSTAIVLAFVLLTCGLFLGALLKFSFLLYLLGYVLITLCYSLWLKQFPLIELFCISSGFLVRLQAGGVVFHVPVSPWLFLSVLLLSLFLSTGKRLGELQMLGDGASDHRVALASYPIGFLMGTLYLTASTVLVTYAMYVVQRPKLIYSVPLCLFGLLRYILRVSTGRGGDPTEALLNDRFLLVVSFIWVAMVFGSVYR